jgi:serine/threonine protein kinase
MSLASTQDTESEGNSCSSVSSTGTSYDGSEEPNSGVPLDKLKDRMGSMRPWDKQKWKVERTLSAACGNYGRVDVVSRRNHEKSERFAVKSVPLRWLRKGAAEFKEKHPETTENPWQDISIMKHLNAKAFPYAVDFMGVYSDSEKAYIMTSLATEGDLFHWSQQRTALSLEREALMVPIVKQIFDGVRWLHNANIAHLDLSLENILLTRGRESAKLQVQIIDFGMSTFSPRTCSGIRGKPSYQAPEMHQASCYDGFHADAFALGVTLFGMACRRYPWSSTIPGKDPDFGYMQTHGFRAHLARNFSKKQDGKPLHKVLSAPFVSLLSGLLAPSPEKRWCLGENFFQVPTDNEEDPRTSAWDCDWLRDR